VEVQYPPVPEGGGGGLTSLAAGLKEMGSAKVLFGALNLIPTAAGLALMVIGIPSMMALGAFGANAGIGLEFIGIGLQAMGTGTAFVGALTLSVAAAGFALMTAGAIGLAAVALGGVGAGIGLSALAAGLTAIGTAAATGLPFLGVAFNCGIWCIFNTFNICFEFTSTACYLNWKCNCRCYNSSCWWYFNNNW